MMKTIEQKPVPLKYKLILLLISIIGTTLVLASTSVHGVGLWPDAVRYIATARNLIAGEGYVIHHANPGPVVYWPPLFPALLAFFGFIFNADPLFISPVVNAVIYGLIVFLSGLLAFKCLTSRLLALLGVIAILVSIPLFEVSVYASSEPLFILLTLAAFLFGGEYLSKRTSNSLLLFSIVVGLASLTRYIGIVLVPFGAILIVLSHKKDTESKKTTISYLSLFLLISILPLGVWLIRNYVVSGTLSGVRPTSMFSQNSIVGNIAVNFSQNLSPTFRTLLGWYIPDRLSGHRSILMLLSAAVGFLVGYNTKTAWHRTKAIQTQVIMFMLFIIIYIAALLISSTIQLSDINRYLTPIYVPATLILLYATEKLLESFKERYSQKAVTGFLAICVSLWLIYPITETAVSIKNYMNEGIDYNHRSWKESATIQYLLKLDIGNDNGIYSNYPDALYIHTNLNAKWSPLKHWFDSSDLVYDIWQLEDTWPSEDKAYLIWFDREGMDFLFKPDELQTIAKLEQIVRLDDGVVYSISK